MKFKLMHFFIIGLCTINLIGCAKFDSPKNDLYTYDIPNLHIEEKISSIKEHYDKENDVEDELENAKHENKVTIDIADYYITNIGDPSNLYYIDANNVLWGCGRNNYGQLGKTPDYTFYDNMQKIAENVIHVDYSQTGYVIFLTADHKLYGLGNAGCGALQQFDEFDYWKYVNGETYTVDTPYLLMDDVVYARCGRSDVACMKEDSSIWIFGTVGANGTNICFYPSPVKVLDDAVFVTGGMFNHAALLVDGSVWTWGYNYAGNCGLAEGGIISEPIKVAENVVMVWTGNMDTNLDCQNIADFGGEYERQLENTIILTDGGEFLICGANVGTEEKTIPVYYESANYSLICTYEFTPYTRKNYQGPKYEELNELMLLYKTQSALKSGESEDSVSINIGGSQNVLETAPTMFAHQNIIDAIKQDITAQDIESWAEEENAALDFNYVIPVYTTANAAKDNHTVLETLAFDNQYRIPVISNDKCIGTVTVEQYENKWTVSTMYRNFDLKTEVEKNKDKATCFIEVIQLQGFGFLVSADTNEEFITIPGFGIFENTSGEKLLNWILHHQKGGDVEG